MLKILKKDGVASMVEIIITAVIFLVAAVGIISTVSMLRPKATTSSKEIEAIYVAKDVLSKLRSSVDASTWCAAENPTSPLNPGYYTNTIGNFTVRYTITANAATSARDINMTVNWVD
ncbi:MAG: hypothetical protein HQL25_04990 [Candidatus Omnitrophica bacterium]|nr:hypothetical protein [Candidatus Omnitrophota bacterium]